MDRDEQPLSQRRKRRKFRKEMKACGEGMRCLRARTKGVTGEKSKWGKGIWLRTKERTGEGVVRIKEGVAWGQNTHDESIKARMME